MPINNRNTRRRTVLAAFFLILSALVGTLALAGQQQNPAGGVLRSISTESASAVPQAQNPAGGTLLLAATDQASLDTTNAAGAHLYVGLLDSLTAIEPPNPAAKIPQLLIY
jgi:hypothetical protein